MSIYEIIKATYPELTDADFISNGIVRLQDDGDGIVYIDKWNYHKPLPEGMKVGKN